MSLTLGPSREVTANPLDVMEQIVVANEWAFDRRSDSEMAVEAPGRWCDYVLCFNWAPDAGALPGQGTPR